MCCFKCCYTIACAVRVELSIYPVILHTPSQLILGLASSLRSLRGYHTTRRNNRGASSSTAVQQYDTAQSRTAELHYSGNQKPSVRRKDRRWLPNALAKVCVYRMLPFVISTAVAVASSRPSFESFSTSHLLPFGHLLRLKTRRHSHGRHGTQGTRWKTNRQSVPTPNSNAGIVASRQVRFIKSSKAVIPRGDRSWIFK